jgi:hypothetical protein
MLLVQFYIFAYYSLIFGYLKGLKAQTCVSTVSDLFHCQYLLLCAEVMYKLVSSSCEKQRGNW